MGYKTLESIEMFVSKVTNSKERWNALKLRKPQFFIMIVLRLCVL